MVTKLLLSTAVVLNEIRGAITVAVSGGPLVRAAETGHFEAIAAAASPIAVITASVLLIRCIGRQS